MTVEEADSFAFIMADFRGIAGTMMRVGER
jgi:hypothetical protein